MGRRDERYTAILNQCIRIIEDCLREGYCPPFNQSGPSAIQEAAKRCVEAGLVSHERTLRTRLFAAKADGIEPDWSLWRAPVYQRHASAPRQQEAHVISEAFKPEGKALKICVIGDAHDDPRLEDKSRFLWLGRWCKAQEPDVIIQLGDWATFDSMSTHHERGSQQHMLTPSWSQDLESLELSVSAFEKGLSGFKPKRKIITTGNHENRAARYENSKPEMVGILTQQWQSAFRSNGWRIVPFGEYHVENGVGFTHHPINTAGKPVTGKTGNQRTANEAVFSIVHGHDHKLEMASIAKIGPTRPVASLSAGCSLPWGHVEPYASLGTTGWWWGALVLKIRAGEITDIQSDSMLSIEEDFADKQRNPVRSPKLKKAHASI